VQSNHLCFKPSFYVLRLQWRALPASFGAESGPSMAPCASAMIAAREVVPPGGEVG